MEVVREPELGDHPSPVEVLSSCQSSQTNRTQDHDQRYKVNQIRNEATLRRELHFILRPKKIKITTKKIKFSEIRDFFDYFNSPCQ